jgi:hypothetical protein
MAIPSRQIGWSTKANLLWQISKQLERLTCVTAGGCGTTTTTTTIVPTTTTTTTAPVYFFDTDAFSPDSNYGVCYQPQGNPGLYSLSDTLNVGVQIFQEPELINPSVDGWYIYAGDVYVVTGGNGFITELGINCGALLVSRPFVNPALGCGQACPEPLNYITVWLTDNCNESWPQIGCRVYLDELGTTWLPEGAYNQCNGLCIQIDADGYIIGT